MKKYTFILAFGAIMALTACGSGSTTTEKTDSTVVPVADTTVAPVEGGVVPVEDGAGKVDAEKPVSNEAVK